MTPDDLRLTLARLRLTQAGAARLMDLSTRQIERACTGKRDLSGTALLLLRGMEQVPGLVEWLEEEAKKREAGQKTG